MMLTSRLIMACVILLFAGCASLSPDFEEPSLQINSVRLTNFDGITPQFEIDLHIVNPNRDALDLKGLSYTLHLAGKQVVSGATSNLPVVAAYGEADFKIDASVSLLDGLQLLSKLINEYQENITYEFIAKLDLGSFYPTIPITREGVLNF
ncbi:MAG: LEA type 2 family protein [Gammaproteobacteria bacterium]